jgi:type I restriction-modification system DNA methylase subunit
MNPPYIKIQDLSVDYRKYIKDISDIEYRFSRYTTHYNQVSFAIERRRVMVSITPNSYLYNKSALGLRKYLFDNGYVKEIVISKKKIFADASVYCCITIFTKTKNARNIQRQTILLYTNVVKIILCSIQTLD